MACFASIRSCSLALLALWLASGAASAAGPERKVDYNRDVRPILSENCFACHGPDARQRKARLRLDTQKGQLAEVRNGNYAVAPGKPDESELIVRVTEDDPLRRMPPLKTGKHLTAEQIDVLKRWV